MTKVKVLFLCTGNSCEVRWLKGGRNQLKADTIDAYSAGV